MVVAAYLVTCPENQVTGKVVSQPVGFDTTTLRQLFQEFAGVITPCQNEGMEIGYARVSRGDSQDLDPQLRALTDAGCPTIYQEEASGGQADRPELARGYRQSNGHLSRVNAGMPNRT